MEPGRRLSERRTVEGIVIARKQSQVQDGELRDLGPLLNEGCWFFTVNVFASTLAAHVRSSRRPPGSTDELTGFLCLQLLP